MAKLWNKQLGWILAILVAIVLCLSIAAFLYHLYRPLVLANKISNQDIVGYFEWEGQADTSFPLPSSLKALKSKLDCALLNCPFWGETNALVLRKKTDKIVAELYLYRPDKEALLNTWQDLSGGSEQVVVSDTSYQLKWFDTIAVISPHPTVTVAKLNTVQEMPWLKEAGVSSWSRRWGISFCSLECLNWWGQGIGEKYKFDLLPAYLQGTVRYLVLTLYPTKPFHAEYQLFFTDQFHHPISSKRDYRKAILAGGDWAAFAGEGLASKLKMLEGESQNFGLWQTVETLWGNAPTGKAWGEIAKSIGDYPYIFHWGGTLEQSRLTLTISPEERSDWKEHFTQNIAQYAAILFPKTVNFVLPDGTRGAEYVKNTTLLTEWKKEHETDVLTIKSRDTSKPLLKVYIADQLDGLDISIASPLRLTSVTQDCFMTSSPVEELNALRLPSTILWSTVENSSTQAVKGSVYLDNEGHKC
ncbi:MAG: hypothetical protein HY817_01900 [Candidatus Abawacabacteria bacterium]|nr:hypothetical protein [Candidatus Abawacabacteria bacterium]